MPPQAQSPCVMLLWRTVNELHAAGAAVLSIIFIFISSLNSRIVRNILMQFASANFKPKIPGSLILNKEDGGS